jgi:hypothetical protein
MLLIIMIFLQDGTETREVYNPAAPLLLHVYTVTHFLLSLALLDTLASSFQAGFPGSIVLEDFFLSIKHQAIQTYDATLKGPITVPM